MIAQTMKLANGRILAFPLMGGHAPCGVMAGVMQDIIDGYTAAAPELIARFDALSPSQIYAPVIDLFPKSPARVADIGAGTGRDAIWFADQGHSVLAVEPVKEFREAGKKLHASVRIEWLDDRLPLLAAARSRGLFDLITVCAVWQHLGEDDRLRAIESLGQMMAVGGLLAMSIRHGPGAAGRRVFAVSPKDTIEASHRSGFELIRRLEKDSVQAENQIGGVRWTWLALRKVCS